MADEGLHEIQLNGKQLVFLFMASTVVAVVIFLCGVMVGRGVRAQRPAEPIEAAGDATADPTAVDKAPSPATPAAATPTNAPVAANEILTYPSRLGGQDAPDETLKLRPASAKDAAPAVATSVKVTPLVAKPAVSKESASARIDTPAEPPGSGFVVQIAAVNDRGEAEAIAKRMTGKGYPTFVTMPRGGPKMFRVRIGKYQTRREAETIAARLEKEDQFKPWITK
ncbi:MAG TPA: SPOR domain-containing protein [Vicinamibacterales bacterium]|jgi:septal ring-binding cell division protein DamX|nr:SPOR domain-containing protein [Vicinamibacterales bacterium]